jgi:hypothetical protein
MAVANGFGKVTMSGSVFMYDTGDTINSYIGEPTTNLALFGMDGSFNTDYPSNCTFSNDAGKGYKGRDAKKVIASPGQWNIYRYPRSGNYTATSSTIFTYSFKIKWADGHTPYFSNGYLYVDAAVTYPGITVIPIDDGWYLCYCTYSGTSSPPWLTGFSTSDYGTCWICDWQLEAKSHPTPYVGAAGTRSSTQGLLPLVGNSTINLSNVSFDSNAQIIFDGTDDKIDISYYSAVNNSMSRSWEVIVRPTATMTYAGIFGNKLGYGCSYYCNGGIYLWDGNWVFNWYDNSSYQFLYSYVTPTANQYFHIVGTYDATDQKPRIYVNGELKSTYGSSTNMNYGSETYVIDIGWNSKDGGQHYFQGQIPVTKYYQNKALSTSEVKQNYNKYKSRFNLP